MNRACNDSLRLYVASISMGNCVGSGSKSASRDLKDKPTKKRDVVLKHVSQDGQDGRLSQK